jgi:hypothetical protein
MRGARSCNEGKAAKQQRPREARDPCEERGGGGEARLVALAWLAAQLEESGYYKRHKSGKCEYKPLRGLRAEMETCSLNSRESKPTVAKHRQNAYRPLSAARFEVFPRC